MYLASRRGDYLRARRGDPGLLGTLGSIVGKVAGVAGKILPFPGNVVASQVQRITGGRPAASSVSMPGVGSMSGQVSRFQESGYRGSVQMTGAGVDCPKGYRPNKTGYFLRNGTFIAPGSKCVKYRYRNVANGRALRRAIGRTASFDKLVKRNRKALRALAKI